MGDRFWRFQTTSLIWICILVLLLTGSSAATTTGTTRPVDLDSAVADTLQATTAAESVAVPGVTGAEPDEGFPLALVGGGVILIILAVVIIKRRRSRKIHLEAYLFIGSGDRAGSRYRIEKAKTKIGSQLDNDLVLNDDYISRHHLLLSYEGGTFVAVDLNSLYGTFIDEKRIEREELAPGKKVNLGGAVDLELSVRT